MERGDVHFLTIDLPDRATGQGTIAQDKLVVVVRGGQDTQTEADVPILVASTNRRTGVHSIRKFEVAVGTAEGFVHDTVIDCRWVYTLQKTDFPSGSYRFSLPKVTMESVSLALVFGLQLYTARTLTV